MKRLQKFFDVRPSRTCFNKIRCNPRRRVPIEISRRRNDDRILTIHRVFSHVKKIEHTAAIESKRYGKRHVLRDFVSNYH